MPTYDYICDNCGHEFETYQSMKDDKLTVCPNCGKETLKRLIGSGSGLIFKGSGFYLTDYKNKPGESSSSKSVSSDSKKSEPVAASPDSSKTETKADSNKDSIPSGKKETKPKTEKE